MNKVIINSNEFNNKIELHKVLKKKLSFPDYYGENLDALWDCLTEIGEPVEIEWLDFKSAKEKLGDYADSVLELFMDAEKEVEGLKVIIK